MNVGFLVRGDAIQSYATNKKLISCANWRVHLIYYLASGVLLCPRGEVLFLVV
jgi:hypothetical protein